LPKLPRKSWDIHTLEGIMARWIKNRPSRTARSYRPVLEFLEDRLAPAAVPFVLPVNFNPVNYGPAITGSSLQQSLTTNSPGTTPTTTGSAQITTSTSATSATSTATVDQQPFTDFAALFSGNLGTAIGLLAPPPPAQTVSAVGSTGSLPVIVPTPIGTTPPTMPVTSPPNQLGPGVAAFSEVTFLAPENPIPRIINSQAPSGNSTSAELTDNAIPENPAPNAPPGNGQAPNTNAPPQAVAPGQQNAPHKGGEGTPQRGQGAPDAKNPAAPAAPDRRAEPGAAPRPQTPFANPAPAVGPVQRRDDKGSSEQAKPPAEKPPKDSGSGLFRRLGPLVGAAAALGFLVIDSRPYRQQRRRQG
jgi:hypothetical protein